MKPAVKVEGNGSVIIRAGLQALVIIGYPPGTGPGHQVLGKHIITEDLDHLLEDQSGFLVFVWPWQDLAVTEAVAFTLIVLDIRHGDRLDAPGMIQQDLSVDTEFLIKELLVPLRPLRDIAHGVHVTLVQPAGFSRSDLPEVRQRPMVPEQKLVTVLVQLCDPDAVLVRRVLLRHDIHGNFRQVQVRPDTDRRCDACCT